MTELTTPEIVAIWEQSENNFELIRSAYRHGYLKGQSDQLRKTDHQLNAVLNILENRVE